MAKGYKFSEDELQYPSGKGYCFQHLLKNSTPLAKRVLNCCHFYCSWQWPWPYANQFITSYSKNSVCHLMKLSIDCHYSSFPWLIHYPSLCLTITVHLSDPDLPPTRANALFHILIYMQTSCYWWHSITLQNREWGLCSQIWFLIL